MFVFDSEGVKAPPSPHPPRLWPPTGQDGEKPWKPNDSGALKNAPSPAPIAKAQTVKSPLSPAPPLR